MSKRLSGTNSGIEKSIGNRAPFTISFYIESMPDILDRTIDKGQDQICKDSYYRWCSRYKFYPLVDIDDE